MNASRRLRLILVLISLGIMLGAVAADAGAQTSAETGVSVTIVDDTPIDEGSLAIAWASDTLTFPANGEALALTATNPSATVRGTFALIIDDTRTDPNRSGYTVSLRAGTFTAEGSTTAIATDLLTVADVTGLPEGVSAATAIGQVLDSPVTVLTVASGSAPVSTTVTVTIAMLLPPGTMPGTYSGVVTFDVLPMTGP